MSKEGRGRQIFSWLISFSLLSNSFPSNAAAEFSAHLVPPIHQDLFQQEALDPAHLQEVQPFARHLRALVIQVTAEEAGLKDLPIPLERKTIDHILKRLDETKGKLSDFTANQVRAILIVALAQGKSIYYSGRLGARVTSENISKLFDKKALYTLRRETFGLDVILQTEDPVVRSDAFPPVVRTQTQASGSAAATRRNNPTSSKARGSVGRALRLDEPLKDLLPAQTLQGLLTLLESRRLEQTFNENSSLRDVLYHFDTHSSALIARHLLDLVSQWRVVVDLSWEDVQWLQQAGGWGFEIEMAENPRPGMKYMLSREPQHPTKARLIAQPMTPELFQTFQFTIDPDYQSIDGVLTRTPNKDFNPSIPDALRAAVQAYATWSRRDERSVWRSLAADSRQLMVEARADQDKPEIDSKGNTPVFIVPMERLPALEDSQADVQRKIRRLQADFISEIRHRLMPQAEDADLEHGNLGIVVSAMGLEAVRDIHLPYVTCSVFAERVVTTIERMLHEHPDIAEAVFADQERWLLTAKTRVSRRRRWAAWLTRQGAPEPEKYVDLIFNGLWTAIEHESTTQTLALPTGGTQGRRNNPTSAVRDDSDDSEPQGSVSVSMAPEIRSLPDVRAPVTVSLSNVSSVEGLLDFLQIPGQARRQLYIRINGELINEYIQLQDGDQVHLFGKRLTDSKGVPPGFMPKVYSKRGSFAVQVDRFISRLLGYQFVEDPEIRRTFVEETRSRKTDLLTGRSVPQKTHQYPSVSVAPHQGLTEFRENAPAKIPAFERYFPSCPPPDPNVLDIGIEVLKQLPESLINRLRQHPDLMTVRQLTERSPDELISSVSRRDFGLDFWAQKDAIYRRDILSIKAALAIQRLALKGEPTSPENISPEILDRPIQSLTGLSVRSQNALGNIGVQWIRQLYALTQQDILRINNIGRKSFNNILETLQENNLPPLISKLDLQRTAPISSSVSIAENHLQQEQSRRRVVNRLRNSA